MAARHYAGGTGAVRPGLLMPVRSAVRLAAVAFLAAVAGVVLPAPSATAAMCGTSAGVSVVVDFSELGGSIATTCVAGGGGDSAAASFEVDHDLTRVQQFPGAVCKVDDTPADAQCHSMPPTDAYWGLFWSNGSGGWVYSSEGVDSLDIPDGGSVAFAWQDGGDLDYPGVAAPQRAEEQPSSSPSPSSGSSNGGSSGGGSSGPVPGGGPSGAPAPVASPTSGAPSSDSATAAGDGAGGKGDRGGKNKGDQDDESSASASASPSGSSSGSPSARPSDDPSDAIPTADPLTADDDGLPSWVAPVAIAGLFGLAGVAALIRRRTRA